MEQMPHHREGIQNELDKAYDEGHIDNKLIDEEYKTLDYNNSAVNMSKRILAELKGDNVTEERVVNETSPELAETVARLKDAGYLDTSFEGKEFHRLEIRALSKEEALREYKNSGGATWVWDEMEKNMPYTTPNAEALDVIIMNLNKGFGIESDELIAEMDKLGVRPITYEELIQYGIAHPSHQEKKVLVGLGGKHSLVGRMHVPTLGDRVGERTLNSNTWGCEWDGTYRFLVVRK